jgi:isopenicillin N synthase-like dioxygenase
LAGASGAIDRTAGEVRFVLTEIGFYFIVNHGVPSGQIREAFRQVARFHAQPLEKKLEIKLDKHNVGYLADEGRYPAHIDRRDRHQAEPQRSTICGTRPAE